MTGDQNLSNNGVYTLTRYSSKDMPDMHRMTMMPMMDKNNNKHINPITLNEM
jgi:hypothetical protein